MYVWFASWLRGIIRFGVFVFTNPALMRSVISDMVSICIMYITELLVNFAYLTIILSCRNTDNYPHEQYGKANAYMGESFPCLILQRFKEKLPFLSLIFHTIDQYELGYALKHVRV